MSGLKRVFFLCEGVEAPLKLALQPNETEVNLRGVADCFDLVDVKVKEPDGSCTTYLLAGRADYRVPLEQLQELTGRRGDSMEQAFPSGAPRGR
jgi:hypothetical protein